MNILIGNHIEEKEIKFIHGASIEPNQNRINYDAERLAIFLFQTIPSPVWVRLREVMKNLDNFDEREYIAEMKDKHEWIKGTFHFED